MATLKAPFALDRSLNTTEVTPRNIADVLAEGLSHITGRTASEVEYDNTDSGLTADNVQDAIDELSERPTLPSVDIQTAVDEFSTYNGGILDSLKVALELIQNLHGFSEPWVGGAGKNKLPLVLADIKSVNTLGTWNGNAYTISGVTYTVGTDDGGNITDIDVNGTATANATFYIHDKTPNFCSVDDYIFSGINDGSSDFFMRTTTLTSSDAVISRYNLTTNTSIALPITSSVAKISVFVQVISGTTVDHQKVYPMIRLSSVVDDSFAPYSNICPITGHTQVEVGDDGKNRFNPSTCVLNKYIDDDGTIGNANGFMYSQPICVKDGSYKFSGSYSGSGSYSVRILGYDKDDNFVSLLGRQGGSASQRVINVDATVTSGIKFVRLSLPQAINEPQLELGSTATAYEPYNGYQLTVNLGGTYYSGTLDVVSGVFDPDTASVDLGTLTWEYVDGITCFRCGNIGAKVPASTSDMPDAICEQYKPDTYNHIQNGENGFAIRSNGGVLIRDNRYSDVASFTSAVSGVKLVYELATPQTIQLSPTMVKALVGENHLEAPLEGQEITESKYKQAFTFDDVIAYIQSLS